MQTSPFEQGAAQIERALLGSVLLDNSLWPQTAGLTFGDFFLDSHQKIFAKMSAMFEDQTPVDPVTLSDELGKAGHLEPIGGPAYVSGLIDHALPINVGAYVRSVRTASINRRAQSQIELLSKTTDLDTLRARAQRLQELLTAEPEQGNWRHLFHSYDDVLNVPPVSFAIDGFLQEEGITLIGGLAGHGKTLCMLAMVRALLEGGRLFDHFAVTKQSERVIYLIPEAGLGPFSARLRTFHLLDHVRDGRLFCRTLSAAAGSLPLTDPKLLAAVKGSDVFLDTAIRFMVGDENSAAEQKVFAETLFGLQRAGARTITGAHHSPKSFGKDTVMTLENVLRGSGDIGAMLVTCWGLSQIDAPSNRIFVQNVKARDFLPCEPFIIQGRPSIDQCGYFELTHSPSFAGSLSDNKGGNVGRPEIADKEHKIAEAKRLKAQGRSLRDIGSALGISKSKAGQLLSEQGQ
ncbi:MAG: DnaB-like helicase N-terminal domain-containing protein [Terriglobales bacterium]